MPTHPGIDGRLLPDFRTFPEVSEPRQLQQKCLELCTELASDMEQDAIMVSLLIKGIWQYIRPQF